MTYEVWIYIPHPSIPYSAKQSQRSENFLRYIFSNFECAGQDLILRNSGAVSRATVSREQRVRLLKYQTNTTCTLLSLSKRMRASRRSVCPAANFRGKFWIQMYAWNLGELYALIGLEIVSALDKLVALGRAPVIHLRLTLHCLFW